MKSLLQLHLRRHLRLAFQTLRKPSRLYGALGGFLPHYHYGARVSSWSFILDRVGRRVVLGSRVSPCILVGDFLPVRLCHDGREIGAGVADSCGLARPTAVDLRG